MSAAVAETDDCPAASKSLPTLTQRRYILRLARTRKEVEAALRLRFEIFNLELHEGLAESFFTGLDEDEFDGFSAHLLVSDEATGKVVGTYRMQTGIMAEQNRCGFYSAREFDFAKYEPIRHSLVELGRACIHKDHRTFSVISLLWKGIVNYAIEHQGRYLIECSSLTSQDPAFGSAMFHQLSKKFLDLIDCEVRVSGIVPESGLIVSNHLSYLDILVISSVCQATFISKSDVRQWPIFGRLARMAGAIFVDRGRTTAVSQHLTAVASALGEGLPVVLFAEGTSSNGSTVLPSRSSLLHAATISRSPITPTAIDDELQCGSVADEICYWRDMVFAGHFWNLLGTRSLKAILRFGTPRAAEQGRKEQARNLRLAVLQLRGKKFAEIRGHYNLQPAS